MSKPTQPTNALIHETSPYLLQHAHNPVNWHPWGEEALQKAQEEDKPILLSIGYSACHWCHVMEQECFADDTIAALMNQYFVNVKVDREERPDLDYIYQTAAQLMGVAGGWPLTVFLTPDQQPFYGGTYFPPQSRFGRPGFPQVLETVARYYAQEKEKVTAVAQRVTAALKHLESAPHGTVSLSPLLLERAVQALAQSWDRQNGGFGTAPKFPQAKALELLLRRYQATGEDQFLDMVTQTLRKMAEGGIYDQLGGGFHRYSVDAQWQVPHFEKMLYDNAQLPPLYLAAYQLTGDQFFARIARETLDYVLREMTHPEGAFYSATDADSEGEEGKFFGWTPSQVFEVLGYRQGQILCDYFGITAQGNFEHGSVLHVHTAIGDLAGYYRMSRQEIQDLLEQGKRQLFTAREQRIRPFRDEKILTSWNGLMISALAQGAQVLGERRYAEAARRAADFILERMLPDGRLQRSFKDGQSKLPAYLEDYACLTASLLDLFETTFEEKYLRQAQELARQSRELFWDPKEGTFFFTPTDHEELLIRPQDAFDQSVPSGQSVAVFNLLRLYSFTGEKDFRAEAEAVLGRYQKRMAEQPWGMTSLLCALDCFLSTPKEIVLVAPRSDSRAELLWRRIQQVYLPNRVLYWLDPTQAGEGFPAGSPLLQGRSQIDGQPTVYVCENFTCAQPVTTWEALEPLLAKREKGG